MNYNKKTGLEILKKYFGDNPRKMAHSLNVGNLSFIVADMMHTRHPELEVDPDLACFLGYVHDVGQRLSLFKHELRTIELLIKEGVSLKVAFSSMHGQTLEQFGYDPYSNLYTPVGYEGKIITVADMIVDPCDGLIAMEIRAERIKKIVRSNLDISPDLQRGYCTGMDAALPRYQRYRDELFRLADTCFDELKIKFDKEYVREQDL